MREELIRQLREQMQQERRRLLTGTRQSNEAMNAMSEDNETELEEEGQQDRDSRILEELEEHEQTRIAEIDAALARMDAGTYGRCKIGRASCRERV